MAEFCLSCWNKMNNTKDEESKYILSRSLELCEECGEWKHIIIAERKGYFIFPLKIVFYFLFVLWKLLTFPYIFYIGKKRNKRNL